MTHSIDETLAHLRFPITPEALCRILDEVTNNCDACDFVADRGARQSRECWTASQFLTAYSRQTGRQYEITRLSDAPDIGYRDIGQPERTLSIEAVELISPGERRSEEYFKETQQREACERTDQAYTPSLTSMPHEAIEAERQAFAGAATTILRDKFLKDYGPHCTFVLYVNLWLFDDEPVLKFVATCPSPNPIRFREIWFLYGATIIPLVISRQ